MVWHSTDQEVIVDDYAGNINGKMGQYGIE